MSLQLQNVGEEEKKEEEGAGESSDEEVDEDEDSAKAEQKKYQLKTWKTQSLDGNQDIVYIEKYKGSPLSIDISIFQQTRTNEGNIGESNMFVVDLLKNLGLQFTSITGAPFQLNALEIENVYGSQAIIQGLLQDHYMSNIKSNALKLVGSTDLIGNPTDLVSSIGTGVNQFFYEPKEGFMQGPI